MHELNTKEKITWCPGCGGFVIETAVKQVLKELIDEGKLKKENLVAIAGIGCHGRVVDYLDINSFYSLHGRVIPPGMGMKLSNDKLKIIGFSGDGDSYGEGLSHLIFAAKRNVNMTLIVNNNRTYGLTTGQFSPTSPESYIGKSTPSGSPEKPLNPIELVLTSGATFVARGFSGNLSKLKKVVREAILHEGFSVIDFLMPCVSFFNELKFYKDKGYYLEDEKHDTSNYEEAIKKSREWDYSKETEKIPFGIFYKIKKPTFEEKIK